MTQDDTKAQMRAAVAEAMRTQHVKQVREQLAKVRAEVDATERMLVALFVADGTAA